MIGIFKVFTLNVDLCYTLVNDSDLLYLPAFQETFQLISLKLNGILAIIDQDERKVVEGYGGEIVLLPMVEGVSSSIIVEKIKKLSDI